MIEPVMTPEAWHAWDRSGDLALHEAPVSAGGVLLPIEVQGDFPRIAPECIPRVVSVLNDALPVESPVKITRRMVDELGTFIPGLMTVQYGMPGAMAKQLIALHGALHALLRPADG